MHLTVEEALSVYPLSEAKLIAGSKGKKRIVKSINVMDAPDISDWIKEGEMLLTTAYLIKDAPDQAADLLRKLNRRGSSALGIKLGRFWDSIPAPLVAEAESLGFPLIELPFQFTFSDQMNGLFRAEFSRNNGALQQVMEKQRRLMGIALQPAGGRTLPEAVSECMGHPLAIIGRNGEILFNNSLHAERELLHGSPWTLNNRKIRIGEEAGYRLTLLRGEEMLGTLVVCSVEPLLLPIEENLFVQGAELIAHHLKAGAWDCFEEAAYRDFGRTFRRYLKGDQSCSELIKAAEALHLSLLYTPFQLVLTDVPDAGSARTTELAKLKEEYMRHPELARLDAYHLNMEEGLLSIFSGDQLIPGRLHSYIEDCIGKFRQQQNAYPLASVSNRKAKPDQIREAYSEVKEGLRLTPYWNEGQQVASYRQLELNVVLQQVPAETMQKYCSRTLAGLLGREPEYVREMLNTLETYLDNDGHINETARKLFIHRNTATYRMEKLSELLDVDFKKTNDLLRLRLAFLFRKMLERGEVL